MTRKPRTPSLRLHKPSGRAVVTIDGQDHYVGEHGSVDAQAAYDRLIVEWISNGRRMPTGNDVTIAELLLGYRISSRYQEGRMKWSNQP